MSGGEMGPSDQQSSVSPYEEALNALSSLILGRTRADASNKGVRLDIMVDYLKMLDLEDPVSKLKVIHVAGTKGKGSTCTYAESILRNCGFRTGLFTSPHLIDVRERFRLDGVEISEEKFLMYFWWCWDRLKEKCSEDVPMPIYFRFLALLGFKIFTEEQVDVTILEVGLGGKFDATNVHGVPAFTVPQLPEAMSALESRASQLGIPLQVVPPLDPRSLDGKKLGLDGEHQYLNAGLAVALCYTWLQKTGHMEGMYWDQTGSLPEQFVKGLTTTSMQGRAQIVSDPHTNTQNKDDPNLSGLVFFLDGAHSPESMEVCARWFCHAIKEDIQQQDSLEKPPHDSQSDADGLIQNWPNDGNNTKSSGRNSRQILLFNCMPVRDPQRLLPCLVNACAHHGVHFHKALFVPNQSVFNKVGTHALPSSDLEVDISWQQMLQRVWENIVHGDKGGSDVKTEVSASVGGKDTEPSNIKGCDSSTVFPSLPLAIKWLRDSVQENRSIRFQVLVTGSLHLIGDLLRLIRK
ncbi:folylpolyglutamate synthase isoform X2 [Magnolia sinica]|uniref:folylpolyglutamate synthase isoform X2 n=1 Tax=Magnolia sinica TaxID=86752 RepID=UPI00265ADED0|nr:folylpolyglutamate synthase isoform X2 [Magnolia sinica]